MLRHLLSVVVAFVASVVAFPLAWWSGGAMWRVIGQFGRGAEVVLPALVLAIACVILLAVGGSILLSGLGATIAGAVHLLAGLALVLWPFEPLRGVRSPVLSLIFAVFGPSSELGVGSTVFVAAGAGLVAGAVLLGAGIATLARARGSASARVPVAIAGSLVLVVVIGIALVVGGTFYRSSFILLTPAVPTGLVLVVLALVAGAVALTARRTAVPLLVAGALTTLFGIAVIAVPQLTIGAPLLRDVASTGQAGTVLTLGVLVLGTGLGVALRARRAAAASASAASPPPPTGEPRRGV